MILPFPKECEFFTSKTSPNKTFVTKQRCSDARLRKRLRAQFTAKSGRNDASDDSLVGELVIQKYGGENPLKPDRYFI